MLKALDVEEMNWGKLSAAVELAGVQKASNIAYLAKHLDEFSFMINYLSHIQLPKENSTHGFRHRVKHHDDNSLC